MSDTDQPTPTEPLPPSVERVAARLSELDHDRPIRFLEDSARTAAEAADALGCSVAEIAKSIVFRRKSDDAAVVVVTSGDRRVDKAKVSALIGAVGTADADFVRSATGFAIGGVSPVAHRDGAVLLLDRELGRFETVWAAAGHPHAVFPVAPARLAAWLGVEPGDVTQD